MLLLDHLQGTWTAQNNRDILNVIESSMILVAIVMNSVILPRYQLHLTAKWVDSTIMARAMRDVGEPHHKHVEAVDITLGSGCGVLVDAGTLLLSLVNQLAHSGRLVTLCFEDGYAGVMGYLDRLAFFDLLHPSVKTTPDRPATSASELWGGTNPSVVEFKRICPRNRDKNTPSLLADALEAACKNRPDCQTLGHAAFTVFGELIDNIYEHSETQVDGYAALQVYRGGNNVLVAVSDSGRGLLETIRPSLHNSPYDGLSKTDLIVRMLNDGLSRLKKEHPERGAGLCRCAGHALKYRAELMLRLPTSSLRIVPDRQSPQAYDGTAFCQEHLPFICGTHFAFRFQLLTTSH